MGGFSFSIDMIVAICLYLATAILSLGIPSSHEVNSRGEGRSHKKHHCLHSFLHIFGYGSCVVGDRNSESDDITEELLQEFNLMPQYSAAAYCPGNNNRNGIPILCATGNCPLAEAAGAQGAFGFEDTIRTDDTGFLAVDHANKLIVLSSRGAKSVSN